MQTRVQASIQTCIHAGVQTSVRHVESNRHMYTGMRDNMCRSSTCHAVRKRSATELCGKDNLRAHSCGHVHGHMHRYAYGHAHTHMYRPVDSVFTDELAILEHLRSEWIIQVAALSAIPVVTRKIACKVSSPFSIA